MWNMPTQNQLNKIPKLYETEDVSLKDNLIYLHFFIGGCDWYIAEYDGKDHMLGFAILNDDYDMAEWGYISLSELSCIKINGWLEVDCDTGWTTKPACNVEKICLSQGW